MNLPPMKTFLLSLLCLTASVAAQPMNVLFFISDDLRAELGCMGAAGMKSPQIDRLAAQGVLFQRNYVQFPLCNPSRTSMLLGMHPSSTGIMGNADDWHDSHPDWTTLPAQFKKHGYTTINVGKIFHGRTGGADEAWTIQDRPAKIPPAAPPTAPPTAPPGKSKAKTSAAATPRRAPPHAIRPPVLLAAAAAPSAPKKSRQELFDEHMAEHADKFIVLSDDEERRHPETKYTQRAIAELQANQDRPFFLACGFQKPHSPPTAPQRCYDLYRVEDMPLPPDFRPSPAPSPGFPALSIDAVNVDLFYKREATETQAREMMRAYRASASWVDENVGKVLAELDRLGLRQHTIVIFWGDHGYHLGEKGKWSKHNSLYEVACRAPLIIHDPRAKGNGQTCARIVQTLDLYPTLLDLCGLPQPQQPRLQGHSLKPLLENPAAAWDHPAFTVAKPLGRSEPDRFGRSVRVDRWRYAEWGPDGKSGAMLIDEDNDPHETHNLVTDPTHAALVTRLRSLLKAVP